MKPFLRGDNDKRWLPQSYVFIIKWARSPVPGTDRKDQRLNGGHSLFLVAYVLRSHSTIQPGNRMEVACPCQFTISSMTVPCRFFVSCVTDKEEGQFPALLLHLQPLYKLLVYYVLYCGTVGPRTQHLTLTQPKKGTILLRSNNGVISHRS